jgi:hypothetical protein
MTRMCLGDEEMMDIHKAGAVGSVHDYLIEWFGGRCPDYEENCICCQKWRAFDELFSE